MNNTDPVINLLTTLAECFRDALNHEMAKLDFERVKWEQHQEMEYTKHLLLGFQLFVLILIFILLAVPPLASMALRFTDPSRESIEYSVPLHPFVPPPPPVPRQPKPEPSLPTVWRYSL
jgi:hypothetical protein